MSVPFRDIDRKKIYRELAQKHKLSYREVREIVESQFEFLAETMQKGKYESVRLPYLGLFHVRPGRIKHLDERLGKNEG